jgi:peroxiredoxin Q/BCP
MKIALLLILPLLAWIIWRGLNTGPLPEVGADAPDFRLADQNGNFHSLPDYAGRWLVLYFYPKDDTPGCTREACAFRDGLAKLQAAGAAVVGVSVDTQESHRKFADKYQLAFPLLADSEGLVTRRYGALMDWQVFRVARRITFLITPAGRIHRVYLKVDPNRHADEILAELPKAAQ